MSSPWLAGMGGASRAAASGEHDYEVVVVGGGFTGVITAYRLAREGVDVALVEAERIGAAVSGHTTAKLSALQQITYSELVDSFGIDAASRYAAGNLAAVEAIAELIEAEEIDCDSRRRDAVIFAESEDGREQLRAEHEAAKQAGLGVALGEDENLPWGTGSALRLPDQLELHPVKLLDGLTAASERHGAAVFERSRVRSASKLPGKLELRTDDATLRCERAVLATQMPILDRGGFFARLICERSYSLAYPIEEPLGGMFISVESPTLSVRSHPWGADGGELLIVGGAGHSLGDGTEAGSSYATLRELARGKLGIESESQFRWSAHDLYSADGLPYAGPLTPAGDSILFASGFRKWGLTNGVWGSEVLVADLLGGRHEDAALLAPNRLTPRSAKGVGHVGLTTSKHMARWLAPPRRGAEDLEPGEGGIVRAGALPIGAYRTPEGELKKVGAACTHVGCPLQWNAADLSWDCPCHGSRFDTDGEVVQGPATRPLKRL